MSSTAGEAAAALRVSPARWRRWVDGFASRHGAAELSTVDSGLHGAAPDGSWFTARLPLDVPYTGAADTEKFSAAARPAGAWGVLLVRRGGFAVARLDGDRLVEHKVGRRHVQGRTKAGGQSQQRFARRRANQARAAFEAAGDHAVRILGERPIPVVTGGDRAAVGEVLSDRRLEAVIVVGPWLPVGDPRRAQLDQAISAATSIQIRVHNADDAAG